MYIAICDDNPQELKRISGILEKFAADSAHPLRFHTFESPEDMLRCAEREHFTHYFLDVMMPGMDGIATAQEIRSFDTDAKIVFLTSFKEYAYQSYRVQAYDYLLKPVDTDLFLNLLVRLQAEDADEEDFICLQNGRSLHRIPLAKLTHIEVSQKHLYFHMLDGSIRQIPGTMTEYEKILLAYPDFIKIHRCYIVNLNHISTISPEGCILFSGEDLPISRLIYKQVKDAYMAHLFGDREV